MQGAIVAQDGPEQPVVLPLSSAAPGAVVAAADDAQAAREDAILQLPAGDAYPRGDGHVVQNLRKAARHWGSLHYDGKIGYFSAPISTAGSLSIVGYCMK